VTLHDFGGLDYARDYPEEYAEVDAGESLTVGGGAAGQFTITRVR
jgi:hypothetical protein